VTNADYARFLDEGRVPPPPWWMHRGFDSPRQPVVGTSWEDARLFTVWLSEKTGDRWRLPTEAEWEFAACGGLANPETAWGDAVPSGEVPEGPLSAPWETGRGTPNGYGLLDMGTIVHEWCLDWADTGRVPPRRASRGGSWRHAVRWSSPFARSSLPPDRRYSDYGFRVLREIA
jgi:formylglycine-generating enzyme required for sulfatase activity